MNVWIASGLALGLCTASPAFGQGDDSAAGRALALDLCANCHVVAPDQPRPPVLSPPAASFAEIAASPDATAASLTKFLAEPHGATRRDSAMPPFLLPRAEVEKAVAYLVSLKPH